MKAHKLLFIALVLTIPLLVFLLVMSWKPSKPSGDLTERQSIALTNALQIVSTKPVIRVGFSDVDNRAIVETGLVTNKIGRAERDGYVFELGLAGWHLVAKPRGSLNL